MANTNVGSKAYIRAQEYSPDKDLVGVMNLLSLAEVIDADTKVYDADADAEIELVPLLRQARDELTKLLWS